MARIGAEELEQLKRDVDLVALVRAQVELKGKGEDLVGLCPFHVEETPSFHVSSIKNLFHCFGCGAAGSVIDWVMKTKNVSLRHAVEILKADAVVTPGGGTVRVLPPPVTVDADDQQVIDDVVSYYHARLKQSPEALAYLEKRGLVSSEMVDHFKLGFADRTLGLRLPNKNRVQGEELRTRLQKLGITRDSGHEHFNGSLVIPILDENGRTQGMYGRKIGAHLRQGTALHLYLPGPHRGVFNVAALQTSKTIILCEALIDALTFWCAGLRNVTSSYGVEGFTDEIVDAMKKHGTKTVQIAYDRDDAGDQGAERVAARLQEIGIECFRVQFPRGMDVNEYALKNAPAQTWLEQALKNAVWMGKPAVSAPVVASEKAAAKGESEGGALAPVVEIPTWKNAYKEDGQDLVFVMEGRRYRVSGFLQKPGDLAMRIAISVECGERFSKDQVEMSALRSRLASAKSMALELGLPDDVVKADYNKMMRVLENLKLEKEKSASMPQKKTEMTSEESTEALEFLKAPNLLDRILRDFDVCGVVGEETNKLVAYLAATSRKLQRPLGIMVRSSSGSGKSSLMDAVLAFIPDEEQAKYSALTDQSLYYMGQTFLKHKVLAVVEEEGATNAVYALKLLQSEGRLSIASTSKDPQSGLHQTKEYKVEGPVMIFATTTKVEIDAELANRCIELETDESREQTRAIHAVQRLRHTAEWHMDGARRAHVVKTERNAQALLKPRAVWNPFVSQLTFPDEKMRLRRDHEKYLSLMDVLALLHQYQRPVKTVVNAYGEVLEAVEVTLDDVEVANRLANQVLGKSLEELPSQTRRLLGLLEALVNQISVEGKVERGEVRLSRRVIREFTGYADTPLCVHLDRLVRHEYLLVHRGSRGQSFVYELIYDGGGKDGQPFVPGLVDVSKLRASMHTTSTSLGGGGNLTGSSLAHPSRFTGPSLGGANGKTPHANGEKHDSISKVVKTADVGGIEVSPIPDVVRMQ